MRWLALALAVACVRPGEDAPAPTPTPVSDQAPTPTPSATPSPTPAGETATDCGALDACWGVCTDLQADPLNCGACGRSCVVPAAGAACVDGECAVGTCDPGRLDCDGSPLNGCEALDTCVAGEPCATACGTEGATSCASPCAPTCAAPAETCNGLDDDCDGACDEGALPGCRVPVHRAYGPNGHLFTTDLAEARAYGLEAEAFFYLYADPAPSLRPFFRCRLGSAHFYTTSNDCELTGAPVSTLGFIAPPDAAGGPCGAVPLYRIMLPAAGWHFYTPSAAERDNAVANLGWVDEGIAGGVWRSP